MTINIAALPKEYPQAANIFVQKSAFIEATIPKGNHAHPSVKMKIVRCMPCKTYCLD
jgi:hypothetical protein